MIRERLRTEAETEEANAGSGERWSKRLAWAFGPPFPPPEPSTAATAGLREWRQLGGENCHISAEIPCSWPLTLLKGREGDWGKLLQNKQNFQNSWEPSIPVTVKKELEELVTEVADVQQGTLDRNHPDREHRVCCSSCSRAWTMPMRLWHWRE